MAGWCMLELSSSKAFPLGGTLNWDFARQNSPSSGWWSAGNPSRLVVPSGVTELEIFWSGICFTGTRTTTSDYATHLYKNGSLFSPILTDNNFFATFAGSSGLIDVVPGDYFELFCNEFGASTPNLDAGMTTLSAFAPGDRLGFVYAKPLYGQTVGATNVFVPVRYEVDIVDTANTRVDDYSFAAPVGCTHAVVRANGRTTTSISDVTSGYSLVVDDYSIRQFRFSSDSFGTGAFWAIPVTEGQVVYLEMFKNSLVLDEDLASFGIEWIG